MREIPKILVYEKSRGWLEKTKRLIFKIISERRLWIILMRKLCPEF